MEGMFQLQTTDGRSKRFVFTFWVGSFPVKSLFFLAFFFFFPLLQLDCFMVLDEEEVVSFRSSLILPPLYFPPNFFFLRVPPLDAFFSPPFFSPRLLQHVSQKSPRERSLPGNLRFFPFACSFLVSPPLFQVTFFEGCFPSNQTPPPTLHPFHNPNPATIPNYSPPPSLMEPPPHPPFPPPFPTGLFLLPPKMLLVFPVPQPGTHTLMLPFLSRSP